MSCHIEIFNFVLSKFSLVHVHIQKHGFKDITLSAKDIFGTTDGFVVTNSENFFSMKSLLARFRTGSLSAIKR